MRTTALFILTFLFTHFGYAQFDTSAVARRSRFSFVVDTRDGDNWTGSDSLLMVDIVMALRKGTIAAYADSGLTKRLPLHVVDSITWIKTYSDTFFAFNKKNKWEDMIVLWYVGSLYSSGHVRVCADRKPKLEILSISFDRSISFLLDEREYSSVRPFPPTKPYLWLRYTDVKPMVDDYLAKHPGHKLARGLMEMQKH